MKSKGFIILLAIACVLAGATYMVYNRQKTTDENIKISDKLVESLPLDEIQTITITGKESTVSLKKGQASWLVENRYNYPARFTQINQLVEQIQEMKIGRSFKGDDETIARLSLRAPENTDTVDKEKGMRILLSGKEDKVLANLIIGSKRSTEAGAGGQYVKLPDKPEIYLVDTDLSSADRKISDWLEKTVMEVPPDSIGKVICKEKDTQIYVVKRPEEGKEPILEGIENTDKKPDKAKINSVVSALARLSIDDVADPNLSDSETGFDEAPSFTFNLYDGRIYTLFLGKPVQGGDGASYLKIAVEYKAPEIEVKDEMNPEEKSAYEERKKQAEDAAIKAKKQKEEIEKWIYIISKWRSKNLATSVEDLLEAPKQEAKDPGIVLEPGMMTGAPEIKKEPKKPSPSKVKETVVRPKIVTEDK